MNFSDKVVLVTGSSRGLGREMALGFAKEQAKVVMNWEALYCNSPHPTN